MKHWFGNVPEEASLLAIQDKSTMNVVEQIDQILKQGIHRKASDLHFEPTEKNFRIRYRKDGLLYELTHFSKNQAESFVTRLKIMGSLDISEHRLPQDGRFYFIEDHLKMDCRISTCPTLHGEKVVIRLLNSEQQPLALEKLGMNQIQQALFKQAIDQPQGLIIVTGPTGSGKTITLYTALSRLHQIEKNILTIEDPIEIQLSGINQTAIQPKIGFNFAQALRAFLRQDPDIIMVGEIRDEETASIAIRAAQTGHLVFSTLHTNSALDSIQRLMNLGISSYNIASTLSLLVSQRLVRTLCNACKQTHHSSEILIYKAIGCAECYQGYLGRTGIFEVIPVSNELKRFLIEQPGSMISDHFSKIFGDSLWESALSKIKEGITTHDEVRRVLNRTDDIAHGQAHMKPFIKKGRIEKKKQCKLDLV